MLPNKHRLLPRQPHPQHDLYEGLLLEPNGVEGMPANYKVACCGCCLNDLKKNKEVPPRYALANDMWIGHVPWALQVLTMPEQLLISQVYPRVFIFKLFPKKAGRVHDPSQLQRAMRGNVTSYAMDTKGVASMVEGKLLPQRPNILASLISVTYIGPGQLSKAWLLPTFWVRRAVVHEALLWLKANNPHYASIDVSSANLAELPVDDVPSELTDVMRQTTDVGVLDGENDGYVPEEDGKCRVTQQLIPPYDRPPDDVRDNETMEATDGCMDNEGEEGG